MPRGLSGAGVSRRAILTASVAVGGGLLLGFQLPGGGLGSRAGAASPAAGARLNAYLHIAPDNTITLYSPKTEMGQGVHTALALLVAEELEVEWDKMRVETAPTSPDFPNMGTGGSRSVVSTFETMRRVGAEAREMLRRAAAAHWRVPLPTVRAAAGAVHFGAGKLTLSYGHLAAAAAKIPVPADILLKDAKRWTLIGGSAGRIDTPQKVDGSAEFGIDAGVPGMLIGAILHCPVFGGVLKDVDAKPAMSVTGVKQVVKLENAVVVLAEGYWPAQKGLAALKPHWINGAHAGENDATIGAALERALGEAQNGPSSGDVDEALRESAMVIDGAYEVPYLAHAPMEPMNATVWVREDAVDVWAPVQTQAANQRAVAEALNIDPAKVKIYTTYLGGGFGRRLQTDYTVQAALASKAAGKPVKLIWSREQDIRHGTFRPRAKLTFRAGLDKSNKPIALKVTMAENSAVGNFVRKGAPQRDNVPAAASVWLRGEAYSIPNTHFAHADVELAVPVGPWRSVQYSHNGFFGESIIDEIAHAAGADPLAFRKDCVTDPRHAAVLKKVGEMSGWGVRALPPGSGLGVALVESFGSVVAQVAEVSVTGRDVRLNTVWCAIDCGTAVHTAGVIAQMESAVSYGLSAAFFGQIDVDVGGAVQSNFNDYDVLRLAQAPEIKVAIVATGAKIGGAGEPGVPPIAPALTNAIFAACGERVRTLPLFRAGLIPV